SQPWLYHPEPETEENGRYGGRCQQNLCEYLCPNWHTLFSLVYSAQNGLGQAGHGKKLNEPGHGTKQATHEHQLNLFLAERRPKDVLELFRTQGFHLACQHARYDRRALTVESRITEYIPSCQHRFLIHHTLELSVTGHAHRHLGRQLHDHGIVEHGAQVSLDNGTGSVAMLTVDHGIGHFLHRDQFLRHQARPDITDFILAPQKQALQLPEQYPARAYRCKNQVYGNPVRDKANEKSAYRQ